MNFENLIDTSSQIVDFSSQLASSNDNEVPPVPKFDEFVVEVQQVPRGMRQYL